MKKKQLNKNEEIVSSILDKINKVIIQEYERKEVMPQHINVALLVALSNSLVAEAVAHKQTCGTDPEKRIDIQINGLREQTLQDLKERLSHGEE